MDGRTVFPALASINHWKCSAGVGTLQGYRVERWLREVIRDVLLCSTPLLSYPGSNKFSTCLWVAPNRPRERVLRRNTSHGSLSGLGVVS
jgi:hypothetical protein